MLIKHCTKEQIQAALETINKRYDNNLEFLQLEPFGKHFRVRLTVKDSRKAGGRISPFSGRRVKAACWHVHGHFFEALLDINDNAEIKTSLDNQNNGIVNRFAGNWHDKNVGSMFRPALFSKACECNS